MKDIETVEGYIGIIDRKKSSRNGNPRFMVSISNGKVGDDHECVLAYTMPDSSLGYTVQNFKQGQRVRADVGVHRGTVSLANLEHAE